MNGLRWTGQGAGAVDSVTVRLSASFLSFLAGTQAWQDPPGIGREENVLMDRIRGYVRYADGSVKLWLDPVEAAVLQEYAEAMEMVAHEGLPSAECLGELNAARAQLRRLAPAIFLPEVVDGRPA